jgi:8-oxo-dGTP diphosphatase
MRAGNYEGWGSLKMPAPEWVKALRAKVNHDLIMMPTVTAIVCNDRGEILMQRRSDDGNWNLPGGIIEPGEEPADAVIREVREETGFEVKPERIAGVYGGAATVGQYPNGDRFAMINITFVCRIVGGTLQEQNEESLAVGFFGVDDLPETTLAKHRIRIEHMNDAVPYFRVTSAQ